MVKHFSLKSEEIRENPVKPIFLETPENPRKAKRMPVFTTVILFRLRDPAGIYERARGLPVAMGVVGDSVSWVVKHLVEFGVNFLRHLRQFRCGWNCRFC
jgi:hypothetical protein